MSAYSDFTGNITDRCLFCRDQSDRPWVAHEGNGRVQLHPVHKECAIEIFQTSVHMHYCPTCRVPINPDFIISTTLIERIFKHIRAIDKTYLDVAMITILGSLVIAQTVNVHNDRHIMALQSSFALGFAFLGLGWSNERWQSFASNMMSVIAASDSLLKWGRPWMFPDNTLLYQPVAPLVMSTVVITLSNAMDDKIAKVYALAMGVFSLVYFISQDFGKYVLDYNPLSMGVGIFTVIFFKVLLFDRLLPMLENYLTPV